MRSFIEKHKLNIVFIFLLILLDTVALFYWGSQKVITFGDEMYTFQSANSTWKTPVYSLTEVWHSGNDIDRYFGASELTPHFWLIAQNLWADHVPMFFWCFRIFSIFFFSSVTKWIGLSLNYSLLVLLSVGLYGSCSRLFSKYAGLSDFAAKISSFGVTVALTLCMNNTITMFILARPYMMLCTAIFFLLMYLGKLYLCDTQSFSVKKHAFPFLLIVFSGWLTHYYYLPFYVMVSGLIWLLLIYEKQWLKVKYHVIITVITGFVVSVVDPYWILKLYWGHTSKADDPQFYSFSFSGIIPAFKNAFTDLITTPFLEKRFFLPALILTLIVFSSAFYYLKKNNKNMLVKYAAVIILADYLYASAIRVVNRESPRYLYASKFIWLLLFFILAAYSINRFINKKRLSTIISIICILALSFSLITNGRSLAQQKISYLNDHGLAASLEENYSDISWLVVYGIWDWHWVDESAILTIPDKLAFICSKNIEYKLTIDEDEYLLLTTRSKLDLALEYLQKQTGKEWYVAESMPIKHRTAFRISSR